MIRLSSVVTIACAVFVTACGGPSRTVKVQAPTRAQAKKGPEAEEELVERKIVVPKEPQFVEGIAKEAQLAFKRGVLAVSKTPPDYKAAVEAFTEAIEKDKGFLEAYFNLGMAYERMGKPEKAIETYQRALDENPQSLDAQAYIGKVYLAMAKRFRDRGETARATEYEMKARNIFDAIVAKDPDNVAANNALALYWLYRGKNDRAEEYVKKVLLMKPKNVVALNTRGLINLLAGKLRVARWVFEQKALKEDPNSVEAWTNLGLTYIKLGKTPQAVMCFEKAIALDPDNISARLDVAAIYLDYLHYEAALEQYEAVLKLDPNNLDALIGSGSCLLGLHKPAEAVERWKRALKIVPRNATLYARVGKVYEQYLNDLPKAIAAYEKYVALANPGPADPIRAKLPALKDMARKMQVKQPQGMEPMQGQPGKQGRSQEPKESQSKQAIQGKAEQPPQGGPAHPSAETREKGTQQGKPLVPKEKAAVDKGKTGPSGGKK